jgi:hypothetical protein
MRTPRSGSPSRTSSHSCSPSSRLRQSSCSRWSAYRSSTWPSSCSTRCTCSCPRGRRPVLPQVALRLRHAILQSCPPFTLSLSLTLSPSASVPLSVPPVGVHVVPSDDSEAEKSSDHRQLWLSDAVCLKPHYSLFQRRHTRKPYSKACLSVSPLMRRAERQP